MKLVLPLCGGLVFASAPISCQQTADASARAGSAPAPAGVERPSESISDAIERELRSDPGVVAARIDVVTDDDGVVSLTGSVDNILAKERAARIAETVKGVRAVVDRIAVVVPERRTGDELRRDVAAALFADPATENYEIDVAVSGGGEVTLSGEVQSHAEKMLCAIVAKGVRGVTSLNDEITVAASPQRTDSEIRQEIEQRLRWDHLIDDGMIGVRVEDGRVEISGIVGSAAERTRARMAAWTAGIRSVDTSALAVERWARDPGVRANKFVIRTDEEVRDAVLAALRRDPRVSPFGVDVSADRGVVTLRGVVGNLAAKRAARHDAANTVGVHTVRNRLKVRPREAFDDARIATGVTAALARDPYVDRFGIEVRVRGGAVRLRGKVDSYFEKHRADDIASRVHGVVSVANRIEVSDPMPLFYDPWVDPHGYPHYRYPPVDTRKDDLAIKSDIEDELWWSPFVESNNIEVVVSAGVATLTGEVDSRSEWRAALHNAYQGGAVLVRDALVVTADPRRR